MPTPQRLLSQAGWISPEVEARLRQDHPEWQRADGACPACVQKYLLQTLLNKGEAALHESIQAAWPLDAEAAFGALPTPLRLHADPRFTGKGVTLAMVDSAFFPHPDLVLPRNRIRAWVGASRPALQTRSFKASDAPRWPAWDAAASGQWHGTMTSVAAAGNGWLSQGLYRGLASDASLALVQTMDHNGHISNDSILRALRWLRQNSKALDLKVVNMSLGADPIGELRNNPIDAEVEALVREGVMVVVAAGNNGERRLLPPATAPSALTIGGLDDKNTFNDEEIDLWHSNYGEALGGAFKPELVAPSIWVVAPVLPGADLAQEAQELFARRTNGDQSCEGRIAECKLVTPYYQHVDGTSFAAPLAASVAACMLEANPGLSPFLIREALLKSAEPIKNVSRARQGAGALYAGRAIKLALLEMHSKLNGHPVSPEIRDSKVSFMFHDHHARQVQVFGSWNEWRSGIPAIRVENGLWRATCPLPATGRYQYKFLVDGERWLDDSANPEKMPNGFGGLNSVLAVPAK
jgi:serine protease AprX